MGQNWILLLTSTSLLSIFLGSVAGYFTTLFMGRIDRARLHHIETEIEGIAAKLTRRQQRENSEKALEARTGADALQDLLIEHNAKRDPSVQASGSHKFHPGFRG